jgi:spermidine synthase
MLQAEDPDRVLLISGNPGSHSPEIMKYGARNIRYVERDPVLASKAREGIKTPDTETRVENRDAYRYIKASRDTFDVIIMLLPPPSTLSLNRFYTTEFFRHVRERLSPGGIFMCSPGSNDYYFNDESINLFSSIHNSLRTSFGNVVPVAGSKFFFIASDKDISVSFASLAAEKNIQNLYVSNAFFQDDLTEARTAEIKELMDPSVKQNRTTCPVASFHFQSYNFSKSMNEKLPAILLLIAAFLIPLPALRRRNMIMYFSAASLAGFEIIILLAVQLAVGNMYQITGLVIAVLMAGLALGAGTGNSILDKTDIRIKALAIASWYILMATGINAVTDLKGTFLPAMLILFSVLPPAFFTGHLFRVLTLRDNDDPGAGAVYSADLAGSALGFILLSGVAVPALGIRNSIIMLSVFIFAGLIFGRSSKK